MHRQWVGFARARVARGLMLGLLGTGFAGPMTAFGDEFDGPSFRSGMWSFERTLENRGPLQALPRATFVTRQEVERCVDPTEAMKETFRASSVGSCHSAVPERRGNRYIFSLRCDAMGPVRTEIAVESDAAYTETNELTVGKFARKETVVARRIGDCAGNPPATYDLAGASSRPVELKDPTPMTGSIAASRRPASLSK